MQVWTEQLGWRLQRSRGGLDPTHNLNPEKQKTNTETRAHNNTNTKNDKCTFTKTTHERQIRPNIQTAGGRSGQIRKVFSFLRVGLFVPIQLGWNYETRFAGVSNGAECSFLNHFRRVPEKGNILIPGIMCAQCSGVTPQRQCTRTRSCSGR